MATYEDIAKSLQCRLAELTSDVAAIDTGLQSLLSADWEEQDTQLEGQDALESVEKTKLQEISQIRAASRRIEDGAYGICTKCG